MEITLTWCIVCAVVFVLCIIQIHFFDNDFGQILTPFSAFIAFVSLAISFVTGVIVLWHVVHKWILTNLIL